MNVISKLIKAFKKSILLILLVLILCCSGCSDRYKSFTSNEFDCVTFEFDYPKEWTWNKETGTELSGTYTSITAIDPYAPTPEEVSHVRGLAYYDIRPNMSIKIKPYAPGTSKQVIADSLVDLRMQYNPDIKDFSILIDEAATINGFEGWHIVETWFYSYKGKIERFTIDLYIVSVGNYIFEIGMGSLFDERNNEFGRGFDKVIKTINFHEVPEQCSK